AHFKLVDNAQARIRRYLGYIFSSLLKVPSLAAGLVRCPHLSTPALSGPCDASRLGPPPSPSAIAPAAPPGGPPGLPRPPLIPCSPGAPASSRFPAECWSWACRICPGPQCPPLADVATTGSPRPHP